jgi:hypothetical protein
MHILHLEAEFIPQLGYQVNVISRIMASMGHEVTVLSTKLSPNCVRNNQKPYLSENQEVEDTRFTEKYNVRILRSGCLGILSDRHVWSFKTYNLIKELNPDVLFLHNNDTIVTMIYLKFFLKRFKIPVVMDSHMVSFASKNRFAKLFRTFYRFLITPIIVRNNLHIIKTVDDNYLQDAFDIPENLTPLISFGSDTEHFKRSEFKRNLLRKKFGIQENEKVFIYSGKLSEDKNGEFLALSISEEFSSFNYKPVFLIISSNQGEYAEKIESLLEKSKNRIVRIPFKLYSELPDYFSVADVAIIHHAGSLTYFDYLSMGLPVIWPDLDFNRNRSVEGVVKLFRPIDCKSFREKINEFLEMKSEQLNNLNFIARSFVEENYSYKQITNSIIDLMIEEIKYRKFKPYIK